MYRWDHSSVWFFEIVRVEEETLGHMDRLLGCEGLFFFPNAFTDTAV